MVVGCEDTKPPLLGGLGLGRNAFFVGGEWVGMRVVYFSFKKGDKWKGGQGKIDFSLEPK